MDEEDFVDILSAVQTGDLEVIVDVVEKNIIEPGAVDKDGCSLLHWAAINNRCDIAQYLIAHGAQVNVTGGILKESPLAWAVRKNFHPMVLLLLQAGSNVNHYSTKHLSALHLAIKLGKNDNNNNSNTCQYSLFPLHFYFYFYFYFYLLSVGDMNLVFMLLYYGADPNATDAAGDPLILWFLKAKIHPELMVPYITLLHNYDIDISLVT